MTWNPEERKGAPVQWGVFPDFWRTIEEIKNPISAAVAEILRRRRAENEVLFPGCELVFPTIDRGGRNVVHIKNAEEDGLRDFGYTPHRARDTFATACAEAGVSVLATKMLLNHRDKTVTEGYRKLSMYHLRGELERVTAFLLGKAGVAEGESTGEAA